MKMQRKLPVFLVLVLVLIAAGCEKKPAELSQREESEVSDTQDTLDEKTEQKILTFSLSGYSEGGKRSWDLKGDSADILTTDVVLLKNVFGHSYTNDNTITLTADEGEFDKSKSNLLLKENVIATTVDGARMMTDALTWNANREEVDTDAKVEIKRENMKATGLGAFGQPDLKQMQLKKDVTVTLEPTTVITCDGPLKVDTLNNMAVFNNEVLVVDERGKIWADVIEVYFDPEAKTLTKVFAKGNVKIERDENVTYSKQAIYDTNSKLITLSGRPRLVIHSKEGLNAFTGN